ncbi:MAG: lipopolysaccharide transport periplasmic protein LptA [Anaerolineae bacterium]|nr:lipopolysaccharide transport periplasmic protein LptA [Anaerolineae bacterium]
MLALGLVMLLTAVQAEETQQEEPIYIESDSLKIDDIQGISIYRGNVVFRQGPDTLKADELVIHTDQQQEIRKVVATGKPAHFDHAAELPEDAAWGEAHTIEYYAQDALVVLNGDARFEQASNQFTGNRVEYTTDKKVVKAGKNVADEGRVQIVIQPKKSGQE